ncbi:MAG: hypothetical protein ACK4RZ_11445 [Paracoccaceae bacterium]
MEDDFAYRRSYQLNKRYALEFVLSGRVIEVRWTPDVPKGRKMWAILPAYRKVREDFLSTLDLNIAVVEI